MPSSLHRLATQAAVAVLLSLAGAVPARAAETGPVLNDCALYPIALSDSVVARLAPGDVVPELPRGTGPGNYSWLSWTGANDAPTLAVSLTVPDDSDTWFNPDQPADRSLDAGDYAQGGPGSVNSAAVRAAMQMLLTRDIVLPVFDVARDRGSRFDYRVKRFATVRLRDYDLTGNGWIGFQYQGAADCYNDAPIAQAQSASTEENVPIEIELQASDADGDALEFRIVEAPTHGTLSGIAPTLTYTPTADYHGPDQFRFTARDAAAESAPATVSIAVVDGNDPPIAHAQSLRTDEDTALPIVLSAADADGDALSFQIVQGPAAGELTGTPPTLIYTPAPQWSGSASFSFRAADAESESSEATVEIVVDPVQDPPTAMPQALETDEDTALAIALSGADADADPLRFHVVSGPSHGRLDGDGADRLYTPAPNFHGDDVFAFASNDGYADSPTAQVTLRVRPVNDPPVALDQSLVTTEDTPLELVLAGTDEEGDALVFSLEAAPAHGVLSGAAPNLKYSPQPHYEGADAFTFRISDGTSESASATVTIAVTGTNAAPRIVSTPAPSIDEGASYAYDLQAEDPDGDVLSHSIERQPSPASIDADSGLLAWPAAAPLAESTRAPHLMCRRPSGANIFDPQVAWSWSGYPGASDVFGPVLVGQFTDDNGDGTVDQADTPDLVTLAGRNGIRFLVLIDGGDGSTHWSVQINGVAYYGSPAIGDIDGDGSMDIVVELGESAEELRAYDANGVQKWRATVPSRRLYAGGSRDAIALADLEGDGDVEIVRGPTVLEHDGRVRCTGAGDQGGTADYALIPVVADLDLDGVQEIVAGRSIYRPDCSLKQQLPAPADGYTAVGNFDDDDQAEILLVSNGILETTGQVYLFDHDGTRKFGPIAFPGGGALGPPTLANVDADRFPEIGIAGRVNYAMFDHTGALLWNQAAQDASSHQTGSTSFDFEGDGRAELVYADELNLRVYDGLTGTVRLVLPNTSATTVEYPVVADVDADGSADIVLGANGVMSGVRMISSISRSWAPTRSLWNQHTYHVDNINDDGSIPRRPVKSWLTHNTFRLNTFPDHPALALPDLAPFDLRLDESDGTTTVKVQVINRGQAASETGAVLSIFNGRSPSARSLLGTLAVPPLAAGEERTLALTGLAPAAIDADLHASLDASGSEECATDNNDVDAAYFIVRATDPQGLFDRQRFTVSVHNVNQAPTLPAQSLPQAAPLQLFTARLQASDPDRGDGLRYELASAPAGMSIDPVSGNLRWTPTAAQQGTHPVSVRVVDLGGLAAERSLSVTVTTNRSPAIVSTAVTTAAVETPYVYDVHATDPDDDPLAYSLANAPAGMNIDGSRGSIAWTPTAEQQAIHAVVVQVDDGHGGSVQQAFHVSVGPRPNRLPVIGSQPGLAARPGYAYRYSVDASDADNDVLSVLLPVKPEGMSLDEWTGELRWTPDATQLGSHEVRIEVIDGRGGIAVQEFQIAVSEDAPIPPTLESTPATSAKVGRQYHYDIAADDGEGGPFHYVLTQAPAGMTVDATGRILWTPAETGAVTIVLRVGNEQGSTEQRWTVQVVAASVALQAGLDITPRPAAPGATVAMDLDVTGAAGPLTVLATLDGDAIALAPGRTWLQAPTAIGAHALAIALSDGYETVQLSETLQVSDPDDTTAPGVGLSVPDGDEAVTAPVAIQGEITGSDVAHWSIGYQDTTAGTFVILGEGDAAVARRTLATFDPTVLLNGQYVITLEARDHSGNISSQSWPVRVTGDLKFGHYSITFEEVSIPVAGIPVTVTRTYDTRRSGQSLDFGHGWTVDANNVRVHESRRIGHGWQLHRIEEGLFDKYCMYPNGDPLVTVTMPDGKVESFRARALPECQMVPFEDVQVVFEPIDGTDGTLATNAYGTVRLVGDDLVDLSDPARAPIDPAVYTLTTPEGLKYDIHQFAGLRKVSEPNGASLTYSADGVRHSSGVGIDFIRDAQGRIERMDLPDGTHLDYAYDPAGDLIGLTDPAGEPAVFGYHAHLAHYLESIEDARGLVVSRNEYDDDGKLEAVIDAEGHRIEYHADVDARTASVKNRRGYTTTYVYNDRGDVLSETNALGETTTHAYDDDGNELTRTDALGRTTTWTYDARGNALTETNDLGETTTSTWNPQNQLLTQKDASGTLVLDNEYIDHGLHLYRSADALGHATVFRYDFGPGSTGTGNLDALTDALGQTTSTTYAGFSTFQTSETDALGRVTTMRHDDLGRRTEERRTRTRADGSLEEQVTLYGYDDKGRLTTTTHPDGGVTTAAYDGLDQPIRECDARSRCTGHVYDDRGLEIETTFPDATAELKTYDENGNLRTQTDRNGEVTRFVYDAADRLIETIHPDATPATDLDNPRSFNGYDDAGQLIESIDENAHSTTYGYDDAGRRTTVTDALGRITTTAYDARGRRESVTDPAGRVTRFVYDDAGRLTETVAPDPVADDGDDANNPRTRTEYDPLGRKTAAIDDAGRTTRYAYDPLGRLVAVVLPDPVTGDNPPLVEGESPSSTTLVTRYGYDEVGNKIAQTDAEGRLTRWEYDAMGRETARVLPEGQRETKVYNAAGELESHTDFNGRTTRYEYDLAGRPKTIDYPHDADVGFGYDARGERTSATDSRGTSSTDIDARRRTVRVTDADGGVIEYAYDPAGNLRARLSPSQSLVYTYDAANRLKTVTRTIEGEAPTVTTYDYDAAGNRRLMTGGDGTRTEYGYDRRNRLTGVIKKTATGALLVAMSYGVDASGLRTTVEESDAQGVIRTVAYAYDGVKRLTRETIDHRDDAHDRTTVWTYDRVGNRLTQSLTTAAGSETTTYAYDDNDRLLTETHSASGLTTYTYDDNGNTTSKTTAAESTTYAYDDANRLVQAITPTSTVDYVYNADGLRVRQTVTPAAGTPTTTWYLQDSVYPYAQVIEERQAEGTAASRLTATYTFADDLVSQTRYAADGVPMTHFIQADGFGSTRWLTDGAGAITDVIDYDAFGNEIRRTGSNEIEHLYRGEAFDPNVGLYYLRARWMEPSNGRFTQQDTWLGRKKKPASLNKYVYAESDPVTYSDPGGHFVASANFAASTVAALQITAAVAAQSTLRVFATRALVALGTAAVTATVGTLAMETQKERLLLADPSALADARVILQNRVKTETRRRKKDDVRASRWSTPTTPPTA